MDGIKTAHPSFGMIGVYRTHGGERALFGSSIKHSDTIRIELKEGYIERKLNQDWYYGGKTILSLEMSQTQYAELLSSMNMGDGIPVTILSMDGKRMPETPYEGKAEVHLKEFRKSVQDAYSDTQKLISKAKEIFREKKSFSKKDQDEMLAMLNNISANIGINQEFQLTQFQEQMERTIAEAKGEIEAFMMNKMMQLGQLKIVKELNSVTDSPVSLPQLSE